MLCTTSTVIYWLYQRVGPYKPVEQKYQYVVHEDHFFISTHHVLTLQYEDKISPKSHINIYITLES